jgi:hypothetical protein
MFIRGNHLNNSDREKKILNSYQDRSNQPKKTSAIQNTNSTKHETKPQTNQPTVAQSAAKWYKK